MDVSFLTRMPEGLEVSNEGCPGEYIGRCVVRRSQVLRHILEDSEEGDTCPVPISMDRLDAWRAFRDNDVSSLKVKTSELLKLIMVRLCHQRTVYIMHQRHGKLLFTVTPAIWCNFAHKARTNKLRNDLLVFMPESCVCFARHLAIFVLFGECPSCEAGPTDESHQ